MYFAVKIIGSANETKLIIPVQWICNINITRVFNYGINKKKVYVMFHSNQEKDPNFMLPKSNVFVEADDFCFLGKIICCSE
jgi:hypothetical protein